MGQLKQEEEEEAPTTEEIDPAAQGVQEDEPALLEYLPAAQAVQVSRDVTPCKLNLPEGHNVQVDAPAVEY